MSRVGTTATGGCLCRGVRYRVTGPLREVVFCHCTQCRRSSGHYAAATACAPGDLVLEAEATLTWHRASDIAARGFCGTCGGNLFWKPDHGGHVAIFAGTLDAPTGLRAARHIHVASKGDYYRIADGLPRFDLEPEA